MKTFQDLFNQSYRGLASQGFQRSIYHKANDFSGDSDICAYRGADGRRCAVGWLIPDDSYSVEFEGSSIGLAEPDSYYGELVRRILVAIDAAETEQSIYFLASLQGCHDAVSSADECKKSLIELANAYELTIPSLELEGA